MKQLLLCLTLMLPGLCLGQQQAQPPPDLQQPPYQTPPTFPEGRQIPGQPPAQTMPPDEQAPPPQELSSEQAQKQITSHLNSEPGLDHTNLVAKVSDSAVVLRGTVRSEEQRDLALRIVESYAGDRKVVDEIKVQQQT
jgi:hypothetical protein